MCKIISFIDTLGLKTYILTLSMALTINAQSNTKHNNELIKEDNYSPAISLSDYLIEQQIEDNEECTIGVASGLATSDGRPLVWKTRDNSSAPNNEVYYNTSYPIKFLSVITAGGTYAWMGVNENGFAILNSNSADLDDGSSTGLGNGSLMRYALGTCATVADFSHLLDSTNLTGRQTHANFGVIDSCGSAAIYETSGYQYWKFDANDTIQAPNGYILRTNFAVNGGGQGGIERYNRTVDLIADYYSGDTLNYKSILRHQMRDFSDYESNPLSVPYPHQWNPGTPFGYIYCYVSICRSTTVSTAVIQGVLPGESSILSTMWTMLGQPASSITVPYWPVGITPAVSNGSVTAPLCDIANQIKSILFDYSIDSNFIDSYKLRDEFGDGLWKQAFSAEDSLFEAADSLLNSWRLTFPATTEILNLEINLANYAHQKLNQFYNSIISSIPISKDEAIPNEFYLGQNYPNPFNPETKIEFDIGKPSYVTLNIYNLLGKKIETLISGELPAGKYEQKWNINKNNGIASGIYFYRLITKPLNSGDNIFEATKRLLVMK